MNYITNPSFSVLHWNLNETRTFEFEKGQDSRIGLVAETILALTEGKIPDFASFAELEYDLPGVPTSDYVSQGKNLTSLFNYVKDASKSEEWESFDTTTAFKPGNCGMDGRAKEMSPGVYYSVRNAEFAMKQEYGDPLNCLATLPAQYGVGFWTKHKIVDLTVVSKLTWKQFNPSIDLTQYLDINGNPLPEDITLFDKCCMIVKVNILDKPVNFVVLHTVPAYAFGETKNCNIDRNNDQLAFLQWLLTKNTYFTPPTDLLDDDGKTLTPFAENERVIALGDLNEDLRKAPEGGAVRLSEIVANVAYQVFPYEQTTETGYDKNGNPINLQLDYQFSTGVDIVPGSQKIGPIEPGTISDHGAILVNYTFKPEPAPTVTTSTLASRCTVL